MLPRHLSFAALFLLLAGCDACRSGTAVDTQDTALEPSLRWDPAHTVVLVTIDSLSPRILLDSEWSAQVTPNMGEVFDEGVVLENVLTPQGATRPALATLATGLYPESHGARTNYSELRNGTTLLRRFKDAGYYTMGYSANQCPVLLEEDMDDRVCTWIQELKDDLPLMVRDQLLVEQLNESLLEVPDEQPLFVWLHLNNVHKPYQSLPELVDALHPEPYAGPIDPADDDSVALVTLGQLPYTEQDRHYLEAVYAAQLQQTDELVGSMFDVLAELSRWDEAVVVLGADHGEELADREDIGYFWHGCSPYGSVLRVVYGLRAPGRLEGGGRLDGWVGMVDLAPTIVELASAFPWSGDREGRSVVDYLLGEDEPGHAVFASRNRDTAVMVADGYKYIYNSTPEFQACLPYNTVDDVFYPVETEELYDLAADPDERSNLVDSLGSEAATHRTELCEWMASVTWVAEGTEESTELYQMCQDWLCSVGSEACED